MCLPLGGGKVLKFSSMYLYLPFSIVCALMTMGEMNFTFKGSYFSNQTASLLPVSIINSKPNGFQWFFLNLYLYDL